MQGKECNKVTKERYKNLIDLFNNIWLNYGMELMKDLKDT